MNKESNLKFEAKKVSGFIPDILCIPVDSPLIILRSLRIDDLPGVFPSVCQTPNSSGRFMKNHVKPECCAMQDI